MVVIYSLKKGVIGLIYLDNASTSFPKPEGVYYEVVNCMKNYAANPGRGAYDMSIKATSKILEVREGLSEIFNIPNPFNIVFTSNATEALNIAIKGCLSRGDHVIATMLEHNSVLRPLNSIRKDGIEITFLGANSEGVIDIEDLKTYIRKNTKMVIVNHVSNVLGTIQNIKEIGEVCKSRGIIFLLDASQSAGILSIDVDRDNIDLMAFSGHKGLYGPQGTGGLYIKEGIVLKEFISGGTGSNSNSMKQPEFFPDKFESGTLNTPGISGLGEGIKFIKNVGRRTIFKKESMLVEYLLKEFKKMDYIKVYGSKSYKNRCAVISINVIGIDSSEVGFLLNENEVAVRTGFHCAPLVHGIIDTGNKGTVRISPGYFNTIEDMEALIKAIRSIYKNRK